MTLKVATDAEIIEEAMQVLVRNMPPSKVARLLTIWKVGKGDYLSTRDQLFAGDTLESLVREMKEIEAKSSNP